MSIVETYLAAVIGFGTISIFVPGPVGARALIVLRVVTRARSEERFLS